MADFIDIQNRSSLIEIVERIRGCRIAVSSSGSCRFALLLLVAAPAAVVFVLLLTSGKSKRILLNLKS
mgnify:CR=1 FL=1